MGGLGPQEVSQIARGACIFGFPFVANYHAFVHRLISTHDATQGAGFNRLVHNRELFAPQSHGTCSRDTLYSLGIIDLRREPVVISVPEAPDDQFYMLQIGDTSTERLPYISTMTTDNQAGEYVLVGPDFQGPLRTRPFNRVIATRGQFVVVQGHVVVLDPDDLSPAYAIQDGIRVRPLSAFLYRKPPPEPEPVSFLPWDRVAATGLGIFCYINMALAWHPPATHEVDLMASFAQIGVGPGRRFSTADLPPKVVSAMEEGITEAKAQIAEAAKESADGQLIDNWHWSTKDVSRFGTDYLLRAAISSRTIYPHAPDHALDARANVDLSGDPLVGKKTYELRFASGRLPPVYFAWSVTLYDAETTAMYDHPLERYSISDRTEGLPFNEDGSLAITIGHEVPQDKANWLPAPAGTFYLVLRLYGPKPEVLADRWTPPPVRRVD